MKPGCYLEIKEGQEPHEKCVLEIENGPLCTHADVIDRKEQCEYWIGDLKPCPFCGGRQISLDADDDWDYYVICDDCLSRSEPFSITDNGAKRRAISAWNKRIK